jgi:cytochrome c551
VKSKISNQKSRIKNLFWLVACGLGLAACSQSRNESTKYQQYYVQGEQLYIKNCSNCHQKNGVGLGLVYPPLSKSDYMDQHFDEVICIMKYGKEGEIVVNGKKFNKPMKGITALTELELAEIATYIYNTWSHQRGIVEIPTVEIALKKCEPE